MRKKRVLSKRQILKTMSIPEEWQKGLSSKEMGLVKYVLSQVSIKELAKLYRVRKNTFCNSLPLELVSLGQKLAFLSLFNTKILIDWSKTDKPGYIDGFMDCKKQVKEVTNNGFKEPRRKTK